MWEIIDNLPGWAKLTGLGIPILLVFLLILYVHGENEAIELPKQINEMKANVTEEVMEETTGASLVIISDFNKMGKDLAEDIDDPALKTQIIFLSTFAGFLFALAIVLAVASSLKKAFGG